VEASQCGSALSIYTWLKCGRESCGAGLYASSDWRVSASPTISPATKGNHQRVLALIIIYIVAKKKEKTNNT